MVQYIDLPEVTTGGVDYITTAPISIRGGDISVPNLSNLMYKTPYQLKYTGMLVKTASDGDLSNLTGAGGNTLSLTPGRAVAVPCGDGERPSGWVYVPTLKPSLLGQVITGGTGTYLPLDADLTSGTSPAYAVNYTKWARTTVASFQAGDLVGMPMAASAKMVANDEVSCAGNGLVNKATSGDIVIGRVKTGNDNSAGAAGALNVEVEICDLYAKA